MPPVNSTEKLSPLVDRKNTAARKVSSEMMLNTSACRMKGMVRRILKNSMARSRPFPSFPDRGADQKPAHPAPVAVEEIDFGARHDDRREHRSGDAQAMHYREAAHRTGDHEQRQPDDQRGDVRIEDGRPGAVVARRDRRLRRRPAAQLLA